MADMIGFDVDSPEVAAARRAATEHARNGDLAAAIAELDRIHALELAETGTTKPHSEIRRAKYLQKDGRGREAWPTYETLLADHRDNPWIVIDVLDAMRLHLQREGRGDHAIRFGVAHRLARLKLYRAMRTEAAATPIETYANRELEDLIRQNNAATSELANRWITTLTSPAEIEHLAKTLSAKAGNAKAASHLAIEIARQIEQETDPFEFLTS